jgi:hypothetical protein
MAAVDAQPAALTPLVRERRGSARLLRRLVRQPAAFGSALVLATIFIVGAVIVPQEFINL